MDTKHLINYTWKDMRNLYAQGILSQAQYEAYDFTWCAMSGKPFSFSSLPSDSKTEFWTLYRAMQDCGRFTKSTLKILRQQAI